MREDASPYSQSGDTSIDGTMPATSQGQELIRRAPAGYLWNQAFSLWLYISLLLYELVVRRSLPLGETGVWDLASTAANIGVYVGSLGLTSAAAVYIPRALAEGGPGDAMAVAVRLVITRLVAVVAVALAILWGLPALASLLAYSGVPGMTALAHALNDPVLLAHRIAVAGTVIGTGMANLLAAMLTALMRTRIVFIVGGLSQMLVVALAYIFIGPLGGGADGALSALVLPSAAAAGVYALVIRRVLGAPSSRANRPVMAPMLRLGLAAWLADLANAALLKPLALGQLAFTVSLAQIAVFSSVFQLGHAAALVLLTGVTGVSAAIMSAAYAGRHRSDLAVAWRAVSKLQVLLTVPLMAFCVPHGAAIMQVFGKGYTSAGTLLAIFLGLNILVQLCGATAHEAALYVLGRQQWVVISRWGSLGLLAIGDMLLVPHYGVAGALVAVALAQLAAALFLLALAWHFVGQRYPLGFVTRVMAALVLPIAFSVLWRPSSLPALVLAGLGYALLFLVALRVARPLDAEDGLLLNQVAAPLRAILRPFVAPAPDNAAVTAPPTSTAAQAAPARPAVHAVSHEADIQHARSGGPAPVSPPSWP